MASNALTKQQAEAVKLRAKNLLVSAAAGTGKTTVLVERAISLVLDDRLDVDRLLVVTFTEAAAMEMRERIRARLYDKLRQSPEDGYLRKQLLLLDSAHISTVHAFCLSVLREKFHHLGLDPEFSVLDPDEGELMKEELVSELFEDYYNDDSPTGELFQNLVRCYGGNWTDSNLRRFVINLHDYLRSLPEPEKWFERTEQLYKDAQQAETLQDSPWFEELRQYFQSELSDIESRYRFVVETISRFAPKVRDVYLPIAQEHLSAVQECLALLRAGNTEKALETLRALDLPRLPSLRLKSPERTLAGELMKDAKSELKEVQARFSVELPLFLESIRKTAPYVFLLIRLVKEFAERFAREKQRQNVLDFSDLEQFTYRLLSMNDSGVGQLIRKELKERFDYVLVDEYQDINPVQDAILRLVSREEDGNFFAVGDVKQSIYRFRLAEPALFTNKYELYQRESETLSRVVPLQKNFRSRRELIDGINQIFEQLVSRDTVGIDYDDAARLHYGANYPPTGEDEAEPPIEFHLLDPTVENETDDEFAELEKAELEARFVANRIREICGLGDSPPLRVLDADSRRYRAVEFRDIVVLLRTTKEKAEIYTGTLADAGIPVYAELTGGYFAASEIRDMLNLLRILDNPRQDIPLAAVLRSPLFGIGESALAEIRLSRGKVDFYDAVRHRAQKNDHLGERLRTFLEKVEKWRRLARQSPLGKVIWQIYLDTGYLYYVGGLSNGAQRRANLLKLHSRASQFDKFTHHGVRRFLEFLERIIERGEDFGSAPYLSEAENVVRVMSIHKSKGLEFPIVFLPDLAKQFNLDDTRGDIIYDRDKTIGLKVVDQSARLKYPSLAHLIASRYAHHNTLAEELRILYVAMTRAREKLILSAVCEEKKMRNLVPQAFAHRPAISKFIFTAATSVLDWLLPALGSIADVSALFNESPRESRTNCVFLRFHEPDELRTICEKKPPVKLATIDYEPLREMKPLDYKPQTTPRFERIRQQIVWRYPAEAAVRQRAKISVSELKHSMDLLSEADELPARTHIELNREPLFVQTAGDGLTPVAVGTAMHVFLRHLDLSLDLTRREVLESEANRLVEAHILTPQQRDALNLRTVQQLFQSPLGSKMLAQPEKVTREMPFTLRMPEPHSGDYIVLQGIIDCAIEEDDGFILLDFKTDNIPMERLSERINFYRPQLSAYKEALERIYAKPVKQTALFFLRLGVLCNL